MGYYIGQNVLGNFEGVEQGFGSREPKHPEMKGLTMSKMTRDNFCALWQEKKIFFVVGTDMWVLSFQMVLVRIGVMACVICLFPVQEWSGQRQAHRERDADSSWAHNGKCYLQLPLLTGYPWIPPWNFASRSCVNPWQPQPARWI